MKQQVRFFEDLSDYNYLECVGEVVHTLCLSGSMSFLLNHVRYNITAGDFVIFVNGAMATEIHHSEDFRGIVLVFAESFYQTDNARNNYNIVGHLSLLGNPVMKLTQEEFNVIQDSMLIIRSRSEANNHLFHKELLAALLKVHVLELLDIHARKYRLAQPDSRPAIIMSEYINLLEQSEYVCHRSLKHYAGKLNITTHYLSDVSKMLSGQPATYWIEKFTLQEILRQMSVTGTTLSEIAYRLNFSSLSYLSRFIKKQTGKSPSELLYKK